ncbi:uncharacterized protein IL334_000744 [Kwoniella shivajii]|uniref:AAA+ ATPase domain-containing protein n=1 Tax=Kwoniella shivajii TaxID=564305 RepID=A0ABZ1CPZ8_9TREE|nr:hypothetical protein IL334_000744 [Kwoniella shivajii]
MPILEPLPPPHPIASSSRMVNGLSHSHMNGRSEASSSTSYNLSSHLAQSNDRGDREQDEHQVTEDEEEEEDMHIDSSSDMSEEEEGLPVIHIEIRLRASTRSSIRDPDLIYLIKEYIQTASPHLVPGKELKGWEKEEELQEYVERIRIEENVDDLKSISYDDAQLEFHIYKPGNFDEIEDFSAELDEYDNENAVTAASMRTLPSAELDGIWDTLVYPDNLKTRLLNFCYSTTLFSEAAINFNVIAWNRVILLHGPPGTGKTSLCRALAQKIAIRMHKMYPTGKLIEINSHSLFSKWFSESGKLVQKLFDTITREVDDESQFVVVMIDEVESLTAARAAAMSGNEPSDSMRVVNALLTQLDRLRVRKNVLVMTTSNLVDAIDEAFMSRVDMVELVPLPPAKAVYSILVGCMTEMMSKGLIKIRNFLDVNRAIDYSTQYDTGGDKSRTDSVALYKLAEKCYELKISGRTLRKLPVLAHTTYLSTSSSENRRRPLIKWIEAMSKIIDPQNQNQSRAKADIAGDKAKVTAHVNGNGDGNVTRHGRNPSTASATTTTERSEIGMNIATEGGRHHH